MPKKKSTCRIFISYNSGDAKFARRLGLELEAQGLQVWFDEWSIKPGDSLISSISQGIENSHIFLFILSPASISAPWPQEELRAALNRRIANKGFKVVPILRKDCRIPTFLTDYKRINARPPRQYSLVVREVVDLAIEMGFSVSGIPQTIRETRPFLSMFTVLSVRMTMQFFPPRGRVTKVSEEHVVIPRDADFHIKRQIAYAGTLTDLEVSPGTLKAKENIPGITTILLTFVHKKLRTDPFNYTLNYSLINSFEEDDEFWYYDFQVPTRQYRASLLFPEALNNCKLFRKQVTAERLLKHLNPVVKNDLFEYRVELFDPPYLEGVVFRWGW